MEAPRENHIRQFMAVFAYFVAVGIAFTVGFMLLRFPENAGRGVTRGVKLCLETLIPSMFPFMFLSSFMINYGIVEKLDKFMSPVMQGVFRLPGVCAAAVFFSMTGGLPVGPKMTADLYSGGYITLSQGQRMLFFCMNPGPAFVITAVGYYMFGSERLGLIIYASVLLSSVIIGVLSAFVWGEKTEVLQFRKKETKSESLHTALQESLMQSGRSMLTVCAWVILFSCITELVSTLPVGEGARIFICSILEMTNGCRSLAGIYPVPLIAGVIGFGGICAHMQVMPAVIKLKLGIKYFICARILNGGLSVLISMLLLEIFPVAAETFAMGDLPDKRGNTFSLPLCIGIMAMSLLLLLGDNFRLKSLSEKR